MYQNLAILRMAGQMAGNAALRQSAVAQNVANADTPGYKAVDAPSFAETYQADQALTLRTTRAGHLGAAGGQDTPRLAPRSDPGTESPNGNTVSLEGEMVRAAELRHQHDMALAIYKTAQQVLRTSLGRQG
ncbi:flagellar basal body rod protein FlgB [Defluviimonas sp. 20V17]|uniref:Flagellar basal-body rod protein FlgB n=2 Tax=Allgaiera indica TaxID=765699 RepID=A0AAN4UR21_9RHOB|nr:FlgB family protein [Allgaiera indica]KDB02691.1 flagellar basal body rod protein FlgB [Defluviimonas sp. 20V17]GHE01778.1 flagellar biosynthesis protein FlgB [Allgaiera indica]SDW93158.1 flagellar basal-body rod protein FlgB [Allgaiera indica]